MRKKNKERDLKKRYLGKGLYPSQLTVEVDEKKFQRLKDTFKFRVEIKKHTHALSHTDWSTKEVKELARQDGWGNFHTLSKWNPNTGKHENYFVRHLYKIVIYYGIREETYYTNCILVEGTYYLTYNELRTSMGISSSAVKRYLRHMCMFRQRKSAPKSWDNESNLFDKVEVTRNRSKLHQDLKKITLDNLDDDTDLSTSKNLYEKTDWIY